MTIQDVTLASLVDAFTVDGNSHAVLIKSGNLATGAPTLGQVPVYQAGGGVKWALAGAVPAGSPGQIQFNNSGVLGASPNLAWDNTNTIFQTNTIRNVTGVNLSLQSSGNAIYLNDNQQNYITISGASTGLAPSIQTRSGVDANVNLAIVPQGTGGLQLGTSSVPVPLIVANSATQLPSITLTPGNANDVLVSAGIGKTPYWTNNLALTSASVSTTPINPNDVARLSDLVFATTGISPQNPSGVVVHIAKSAVAGIYTNNSGVGTATFTSNTILTVSGATPEIGDIVVLVAQIDARQNGSYNVTANSALGFTLTRNSTVPRYGNFWIATATTASNYGEQWQLTTIGTIVVGTTDINYTIFGVLNSPDLERVTSIGNTTTKGIVLLNSALQFNDSQTTPSNIKLQAPNAVTANYVLKLPPAQGNANQTLSNDGSGNLSWVTTNTGGIGQWFSGSGAPTTITGALAGNYYWNTISNASYILSTVVNSVQTWTAQPNQDNYVLNNTKAQIRNIQIAYAVNSSSLTTKLQLPSETGFAQQVIEAGLGLYWDTNPTTNNPRLNAQLNSGLGWVISIGVTMNNVGNVPGWSSGTAQVPRFRRDGTVLLASGFTVPTRDWSASSAQSNRVFIAQTYQTWNNSFADALSINLTVGEDAVRFLVQTTALSYGVNPTQTDVAIKALFSVTNPNQSTDAIVSFSYDDNGGLYEYQRAVGSTVLISLSDVLSAGNTASSGFYLSNTASSVSTITVADSAVSPLNATTITNSMVTSPSFSTTNINNIAIAGVNAGSAPTITATGSELNISLNIIPKGTGVVNIGNSTAYNALVVNATTSTTLSLSMVGNTSSTADFNIIPKGQGNVILGNIATYSGLTVVGNLTNYTQLNASGPATNIDFVIQPKGTGNFYPLGYTLSSTASNQPKIYVASDINSTTLGPGTAGQALLSNGTSGAPYWGSPYLNQGTFISLSARRGQNIGAGTYAYYPSDTGGTIIGWTVNYNKLGLTTPTTTTTNYISGFSTTALYRIVMTTYCYANFTGNQFVVVVSATGTDSISTLPVSEVAGACNYILRVSASRSGDYQSSTTLGYFTGLSTMYVWGYCDTVPNNTNANMKAITYIDIQKIST